jgi:hypothetical protein
MKTTGPASRNVFHPTPRSAAIGNVECSSRGRWKATDGGFTVAKAYKIVLALRRQGAVKGPKFTICLLRIASSRLRSGHVR